MRPHLLPSVVLAILVAACESQPPSSADMQPGRVTSEMPARPDSAGQYVIYLHSISLDGNGDAAARARFSRVVEALAGPGITVIAEIRGLGTIRKSPEDLDLYAHKVSSQVGQLLQAGVPARRIHVVGYSRGGVIAQMAAGYVARPDVGFGILAGCVSAQGNVRQFVPVLMRYAESLQGDFLSVAEESDGDFGSCAYFAKAARLSGAREVMLRTGGGHLLFAEPHEAWVTAVVQWLQRR